MFKNAYKFNQALCWKVQESFFHGGDVFFNSNGSLLDYPTCLLPTNRPTTTPNPTKKPTWRPTRKNVLG
jgi:hypothetical protein